MDEHTNLQKSYNSFKPKKSYAKAFSKQWTMNTAWELKGTDWISIQRAYNQRKWFYILFPSIIVEGHQRLEHKLIFNKCSTSVISFMSAFSCRSLNKPNFVWNKKDADMTIWRMTYINDNRSSYTINLSGFWHGSSLGPGSHTTKALKVEQAFNLKHPKPTRKLNAGKVKSRLSSLFLKLIFKILGKVGVWYCW